MSQSDIAFDFQGRTAIITGSGQGIGKAYAERFAEAGCQVVVAEVDRANGQAVADGITAKGGKALFVQTDVTNEDSVAACVRQTLDRFGGIDILINNAALFAALERKSFDQISVAEWDRVLKVNINGAFIFSKAVLPAMRAKKYGRIIHISSNTVAMGRANFLHYVTSKAAIVGMARSMARELGPDGITVNAVMPTLTETGVETKVVNAEIFKFIAGAQCLPRTGQPDDLAKVMLFLASTHSGFVTGQTIAVDGGAIHL